MAIISVRIVAVLTYCKIHTKGNGETLKFVFRNFPLRKIHPQALGAAIASEGAVQQDKFWEMHEILFENQSKLNPASILHYAEALDMDMEQFRSDMFLPDLERKVLSDFESGLRS